MSNTLNIYQRMHAVMQDVSYIRKDDSKKRELRYAYVSHDEVSGVLHAALVRHGIFCRPTATCVVDPEPVEMKSKNGTRNEFRAVVHVSLEFVNIEDPNDRLEVGPFAGVGFDNSDKATGKAYSYAMKTALLKTFMLESGERDNEVDDVDDRREPVRGFSGSSGEDGRRAPYEKPAGPEERKLAAVLTKAQKMLQGAEGYLDADDPEMLAQIQHSLIDADKLLSNAVDLLNEVRPPETSEIAQLFDALNKKYKALQARADELARRALR